MRNIDADSLMQRVVEIQASDKSPEARVGEIIIAISEAPTVDAVPVVHGRWKWYREENCVICSECGDVHYLGTMHQYSKNYCPNCGARMDGGENNE